MTATTAPVRRVALVVLAVVAFAAACGDDTDAEDEAADEASFCRLATENAPVSEADATVLARLDELAPEEVDASVAVLRELADELADLDQDDPDALALEFEVRFGDEHIAARRAVETFVRAECDQEPATTTTSSTIAPELPGGER